MKIRVIDRLLCALSGLILLAMAAALAAETVFHVQLTAFVGGLLAKQTAMHVAVFIGAAVILMLLGAYDVGILFRRGKGKRGFVMQKTENGELSISIRAIETLVQQCVDKHEELHVTSTALDNSRDGLIIRLKIDLASGVNIPLAVSALQKQIKQYITACSGVDVREVRVQVETAASKVDHSPYAVPDLLQNPGPLPKDEPLKVEVPETAAEKSHKEKKPLHQRLFGREEQPAIVPAPPQAGAEPESVAEDKPEAVENDPPVEMAEDAETAPEGETAAAEEFEKTEEAVPEGVEAAEEESTPEDMSEEEKNEIAE